MRDEGKVDSARLSAEDFRAAIKRVMIGAKSTHEAEQKLRSHFSSKAGFYVEEVGTDKLRVKYTQVPGRNEGTIDCPRYGDICPLHSRESWRPDDCVVKIHPGGDFCVYYNSTFNQRGEGILIYRGRSEKECNTWLGKE